MNHSDHSRISDGAPNLEMSGLFSCFRNRRNSLGPGLNERASLIFLKSDL